MIKRFAWIVGVVVAANAAALGMAARNGRGAPDATLQMTERELRVTDLGTDTTGMTLTLRWDRNTAMAWFDRAKLSSLGFDCSIPPEAGDARDYYSGPAILPRSVYVVFDYDPGRVAANELAAPPAESSAGGRPVEKPVAEYVPRLRPVDAGNDPRVLRSRYSDRHRYLITAGTVRPALIAASGNHPARLQGQVLWIDPIQIYVPQAMQATLVSVLAKDGDRQPPFTPLTRSPRYEVTVEYGTRWLPKIVGIRALR